ncbi:MAG: DUF4388 domain-containing protein [Acidobacteria bacterium]|nr:DUF4388 domain-containing protein [Acidobacteriota bacterium]
MPKQLSGSLDTFTLADLLQWLEINGLSGRLAVSRGEVRRTIDFKGGSVAFVTSTKPDERLGAFLASRGILPREAIYKVLAESFATGRQVTRILLEDRLLSREALAEAAERLATQVLLDLFHWSGARFEFDPAFKSDDVLQIHLSLRGQVLAFQGAKSVDDSARVPVIGPGADDGEAPWEREFHPETLAATFWSLADDISDSSFAATTRDRYYVFSLFSDQVRQRLREPFRVFPIFDDSALMATAVLEEDGDPARLVQIAALDPFLTLNLLYLANSLRLTRNDLVGTARDAADVMGDDALRTFITLLSAPSSPKTSSAERMERVVRRSSLSTAMAALHVAKSCGRDAEASYTAALVEPLGGYDLLKLLLVADFPPGAFRARTLQRFRPLFGRVLARKLNLPRPLEEVLGSEGRITKRSSGTEQTLFLAKQLSRADQIGHEWTSEDPALADQFHALAETTDVTTAIERDVASVFELLRL